jgi:branched-chain amino acid transport system substrate-binding protein
MRTTPRRTLASHWRLTALLIASALLVASCGNSGDDDEDATASTTPAGEGQPSSEVDLGEFQPIEGVPGVTDEEISFALLGTGPSNPLGYCLLECYEAGVQAYFDYRNDLGGVHGRDLVVSRVEDDEVGNTQVKLLDLVEDDGIFGIFSAPLLYAGYADVGQTDVPMWTTFPASPDADGIDNIYVPAGTICLDCASPASVQAANLVGATKVASLGFGVSQVSKDCVGRTEADFEQFGPGIGVEFVYKNDELAFGFPNGVGPEVSAMKEAGVDFISTCIDQTSALTLEQELQRQGMGDIVVVLPQGYGDDEFLSTNADLLEGDVLSVPYRPAQADAGDTMLPTMLEWLEKAGQVNDYAIQGWLGADLAVTGLLAAGPQFDRAGVVGATNQITDFTAGGLLMPVDWTTAHTAPDPGASWRNCSTYMVVRDGELELQGDPAEPFFCWDLPLDEWAEPETG